jgi:hypothetical protein
MYTARCTPYVLEALHLPVADSDQNPSTALGDWYVDFIHTRKHRLVHFVSDRSFFSVVLPVKTLKTALERHVLSLRDLLGALAVRHTIVQSEMAEMEQRAVGNARSQSVLASMHDLALNARSILERTPSISPAELSLELSQIPCGPLGTRLPAEAAMALLLERHSRESVSLRGT